MAINKRISTPSIPINKPIKKKRVNKDKIIKELRQEIIDMKELYDAKLNEVYINMSIYKERVNKMMHFHRNIIGCLDKIDEIRMEKIMEDLDRK